LAQELRVPTPGAELVYQLLGQAEQQGLGDLDGAAIVLPLEEQAGFQINRLGD
jgi:3-hydroxyisobutyrate dehydrogenase-like beta-hydroxyacid dehydrogenase